MRASQAPNGSPCAANVCHRRKSRRARRILTNAGPSRQGWEGKFPIPAKRILKSRIRFPLCVRLRRATSAATKLDGQRSGADRRTGGKSRTRASGNSSLPSPAGTAQRAARITARPHEAIHRSPAASEAPPPAAKSAKFAINDLQILPCRPRRGRPSAPCARHKRQTIRRARHTRKAPRRPAQKKKPDLIRTGHKNRASAY